MIRLSIVAVVGAVLLLGCSAGQPNTDAGKDKLDIRREQAGSLFGQGFSFGGDDSEAPQEGGIAVNSYLWRASLDTISFFPMAQVDAFGGVIITDWYSLAEAPNERYKLNVYILGRELRADGVRVAAFRQVRAADGSWQDVAVAADTAAKLENAILTRARQLRINTQAQLNQ